jgi:hypothetical protein
MCEIRRRPPVGGGTSLSPYKGRVLPGRPRSSFLRVVPPGRFATEFQRHWAKLVSARRALEVEVAAYHGKT